MYLPSQFPSLKTILPTVFLLGVVFYKASADTIKPLMFGPFFMNQVTVTGSPLGFEHVLTNGLYHFQVGWIEPLANGKKGIFQQTYFETNGNIHVSPFTSDVGTTFNLKPIRYLEFGLSYNRLLYHKTMVTFARPGEKSIPKELIKPEQILNAPKELGGADIFTYQANFTLDIGRTQLYLFASRTLWDIDSQGKDFIFEYGDDLPIRTRDRVNNLMGQFSLDLQPWSLFQSISFMGIDIRNQYWITAQSKIDDGQAVEKNLVSVGVTGMRFGQNPDRQRRGLDIFVGYWTKHYQIPNGEFAKALTLTADWKWNIHFLKM